MNRAIGELYEIGSLTSATLMARASATDAAIDYALAHPDLGIGCHVVLVDGEPVLPPASVPSLAVQDGAFPPPLTRFLRRILLGNVSAAEIEAEARAQIQLLQSRGLQLTHVDTHKHTHMFPRVLRPLLSAARSCGIQVVRNPFEPEWAIRASPRASWLRSAEVYALRRFSPWFHRMIAEGGFTTTDGTIAIAMTGALDADGLRALLTHLPEGTWELVTHPGYNDSDLARIKTRLRQSREVERAALATIGCFPGIELISFAQLAASTSNASRGPLQPSNV